MSEIETIKANPEFDHRQQALAVMRSTGREYAAMRDESGHLSDQCNDWSQSMPQAEPLQRDMFAGFFQNSVSESGYGCELNRRLMAMVQEDDQFEAVRTTSTWDEALAAMATLDVGNRVFSSLDEDTKDEMNQADQAEKEANDAQAAAQAAEAMANEAAQAAKAASHADKAEAKAQAKEAAKQAEAANQAAQQAIAKAQQAMAKADEAFKGNAASIRAAVADGMQEAKDNVEAVQALGKMYGTDDQPIRGKDLLGLAKTVNVAKVKKMADLVGRMVRLAINKQSTKSDHEAGAIVGVDFGNNLEKLMDDELAALNHPMLRLDAMARFVDESMMEFELEEREPLHRGPMVACIDFSGSMSGAEEAAARAFAVALANVARKQGRNYAVVPFNTRAFSTIHFKAGASREEWGRSVAQLMACSAGGGTHFDGPFSEAMDVIESETDFNRADIVFLTDGIAPLSDAVAKRVNNARQSVGLHVYGVLIGASGAMATLERVSNRIWVESEFGFNEAGRVFGTV